MEDRAPPYLAEGLKSDSGRPVDDVDDVFRVRESAEEPPGLRRKRALPAEEIGKSGRHMERCCRVKQAAFTAEQNAKLGPANAGGVLQHGLKHGLQPTGGCTDDTQHLRSCGLLLQRLVALALRTRKLFFKVYIGVLRHRGRPCPPFRRRPRMAVVAC